MLPPTLSMVVPGVRSRGPKPLVANPAHGRSAEKTVHQRDLLAAPAGDVATLGANHADQVAVERLVVAHVLGGPQEFHIAAEACVIGGSASHGLFSFWEEQQ